MNELLTNMHPLTAFIVGSIITTLFWSWLEGHREVPLGPISIEVTVTEAEDE